MSARKRFRGAVLGGGAYDEPRVLRGHKAGLDGGPQPLALVLFLDPRRDAHAPALRHVHQIPGGQGNVGGQAGALGAQGILHDLNQNFIAFRNQRTDAFGVRRLDAGIRVTRIENVGRMQKSGAFQADVDERRLHPRQHPRDTAFVNVADQSAAAGALQIEFLQDAILHDGGARLVHAGIDQNVSAHGASRLRRLP